MTACKILSLFVTVNINIINNMYQSHLADDTHCAETSLVDMYMNTTVQNSAFTTVKMTLKKGQNCDSVTSYSDGK